jgi:hypothetical protein
MNAKGITPLETVAFLAVSAITLLVTLPIGYRQSMKAHRNAMTIRHWDLSLAQAQEKAVMREAASRSKTEATSRK